MGIVSSSLLFGLRLLGKPLHFVCINLPGRVGYYFDALSFIIPPVLTGINGKYLAPGALESARPEKTLKLYTDYGDLSCRKVEETLGVLGLDFVVFPCPQANSGVKKVWEQQLVKESSNKAIPVLVDVNNGSKVISGRKDISNYVWRTYGNKARSNLKHNLSQTFAIGHLARFFMRPFDKEGHRALADNKPEKLLVLWGYEGSPFTSIVREALNSLQLGYVYKVVPHGYESKRDEYRKKFMKFVPDYRSKYGNIMVPVLEDPNTNVEMSESRDIVAYLHKTYGKH